MSYRKIDPRLWRSLTFRSLSQDARDLYIYILTSPHNNALCCYVLPELYVAHDLQWLPERLPELFKELLSKRRSDGTPMIYRDEAGVTFAHGQLRKEGLVNGNAVKAAITALGAMPTKSEVYRHVLEEAKALSNQTDKPFHKPLIKALSERLPEPLKNGKAIHARVSQEQEQEQEQEQDKDKGTNVPFVEQGSTPEGPAPPKPGNNIPPYKKIIQHLNERTGKNFSHKTKETQRLIKARWNSGFRLTDFQTVIDRKVAKWGNDPKMVDYLRPQTLFGTKFESYLNEKPAEEKPYSDVTAKNIESFKTWLEGRENGE